MSDALRSVAARVIPQSTRLTGSEAEAVLEIAYLAIAADHELADDELVAFRAVMAKLALVSGDAKTSGPVSDRRLNDKLDQLHQKNDRSETEDRLREIAEGLSLEVRSIAYKVAHAIAMADMNASDEEFEFDLQLIDALELPTQTAEALVDEVTAMFNADETA